MPKLTVKNLLDLKGIRQIAFVQVAREEKALAAAAAGMDMIGTGFRAQTRHFPGLVPDAHFQFGLAWGQHANAEEALREAMQEMEAGAESIYCGMSPQVVEVLAREGLPCYRSRRSGATKGHLGRWHACRGAQRDAGCTGIP